MSPTAFTERGYRFFFFSLEEARVYVHVHVRSAEGEAKFWLEPDVRLAKNYRYSQAQLRRIKRIVEARRDELAAAWKRHFGNRGD